MKRRPFLKIAGGLLGSCAFGIHPSFAALKSSDEIVDTVNGIPYRMLGRTGEKVSIVGFPGLAMVHYEQQECNESVKRVLDAGINYFDVAPAYGNGDAEIKLGNALKDIDRSTYLLACKTKKRDKEGAREELERSLERLHTDHFDVYQMHHLRLEEEVEEAFAPGGAMETLIEAQKEGKVRFLGFSAHTTKSALEAMKRHQFDTVMFPINFVEQYAFGFGKEVIDLAQEQGAAVLAIKALSGGYWKPDEEKTRNWWYKPVEDPELMTLALSYALSKPGVTIGFPPGFVDITEKAGEAIKNYHIPTEAELEQLKTIAAESLSVFEARQKDPAHARAEYDEIFKCPYTVA